jgi:hypothetical protein
LRQHLSRAQLQLREVLEIAQQIASALARGPPAWHRPSETLSSRTSCCAATGFKSSGLRPS